MISHVAVLLVLAAGPQAPAPAADTPSSSTAAPADTAELIRREVDAKVEAAKKELREEMRAQAANQAAQQGWQEEWVEEKRKLDLFVPHGYFRVRPDLFNKFDLGRLPDPSGYPLFPHQGPERTLTGVNMRFRFEPTLNISEEVRIQTQVDMLNNLVWGSTPDYASTRPDRTTLGVLTNGQVPPQQGVNSPSADILVRRVYGEVSTPLGILRLGRMGSQWGLGMLHNDGNCLDCDYGETVDRAQFVVEPLPGFFLIPMLDVNATGLVSSLYRGAGQPLNLTQSDDTISYVLVAARRDTDAQAKARLENNLAVFNYGLHFTYRNEHYRQLATTYTETDPYQSDVAAANRVQANGQIYMPDLWLKYERKRYRLEIEAAGIFGLESISDPGGNPALFQTIPVSITQWGFAAQTEYKMFEGALKIGFDFGMASGDRSPGFGNHPGRTPYTARQGTGTVPGDIDGPQICIPSPTPTPGVAGCSQFDATVRNFRFSQDYRIDLILWRELLGGITDAYYLRPNASYLITDGLTLSLAAIYSGALYPESTPGGSRNLGVEFDAGLHYETEDGFFADARYGLLIPLPGLRNLPSTVVGGVPPTLDIAMAVRGNFGIHF